MPNITGQFEDAEGVKLDHGDLVVEFYGESARAAGSDVRLGYEVHKLKDLPNPLTLAAGTYTFTVVTKRTDPAANNRPLFETQKWSWDLDADTTWAVIRTENGPVPPELTSASEADAVMAARASDDASSFRAALTRTGAKPVGRGELSVNVKDHGATGDGTTDDRAAILAAITAVATGGEVYFPPGTYAVTSAWTVSKSVRLRGRSATIKPTGATVSGNWLLVTASDVIFEGLTFDDPTGIITGQVVNLSSGGYSRNEVLGCTFNTPAGISVRAVDQTDMRLENNRITACRRGLRIEGAHTRPTVRLNRIAGWKEYGIEVLGTATGVCSITIIEGNRVTDMAAGGTTRYPIHVSKGAASTNHQDMRVQGNTVIGPNKSYTATDPGCADCISIFAVDGLRVIGNTARLGGDMGITIDGSSTNVTVGDNVCVGNDVAGIAVWTGCRDVTITGNVCKDNGRNRNADRTAAARSGIRLTGATNVAISGNSLGDNQGTKTQNYGVSMNTCANVKLGPDVDGGNALALYFKDGGANTSITKVADAAF